MAPRLRQLVRRDLVHSEASYTMKDELIFRCKMNLASGTIRTVACNIFDMCNQRSICKELVARMI